MTSAMISAISGTGKVSADGLPPPNEIMLGSAPSLNSSRIAEPCTSDMRWEIVYCIYIAPDKELNDKRKGHRNPIVGGFSPFADMIIVNLHKLYVKYLLFMTI